MILIISENAISSIVWAIVKRTWLIMIISPLEKHRNAETHFRVKTANEPSLEILVNGDIGKDWSLESS